MKFLTSALLAALLVGCGSKDEGDDASSTELSTGVLSGTVGGMPWTLATMETDSFLSDETSFGANAYAEAVTACSGAFADTPQLLTQLPRTAGEYPLSLSGPTVTFYLPSTSDNLIATAGVIRIDAVTDTQVTGALQAEFDAANSVNGTFTATICP